MSNRLTRQWCAAELRRRAAHLQRQPDRSQPPALPRRIYKRILTSCASVGTAARATGIWQIEGSTSSSPPRFSTGARWNEKTPAVTTASAASPPSVWLTASRSPSCTRTEPRPAAGWFDASSRRERVIVMSAKRTGTRSSRSNQAQRGRADLTRLRRETERQIRASSPPELADLPADFWAGAAVVEPVAKQPISLRVDADVLDWFKSQGPRYQSRINAVLRTYMHQRRNGTKRKAG